MYRDGEGEQRVLTLAPDSDRVTLGREVAADVCLAWDEKVSRLHAELEQIAGEWVLLDDGLSRNGSYVNGERVSGRRRLDDGDLLRFGSTECGTAARAPRGPARPPWRAPSARWRSCPTPSVAC